MPIRDIRFPGFTPGVLWPRECLLCQQSTGEAYFCAACLTRLPRAGPACRRCAGPAQPGRPGGCCQAPPPPWRHAWMPWRYAWPLDRLVVGVKFARRLAWARALGELLAAELPADCADVVVPVPLHPWRLAGRGFNQAQEIAAPIARHLGLSLRPELVRRVRATRPQSSLSAAERRDNPAGAFSVRAGVLSGRRVLLVDDVVTTGATAAALATAVVDAGAAEVAVAAVARA